MKDLDHIDPAAAGLAAVTAAIFASQAEEPDRSDFDEARAPFVDLTSYTDADRNAAAPRLKHSPDLEDRRLAALWLGEDPEFV